MQNDSVLFSYIDTSPPSFEPEDFKKDFKIVTEDKTAWVEWSTPAQGRKMGHPAGCYSPRSKDFLICYKGKVFPSRTIAWVLLFGSFPEKRVVQTSALPVNCHPDYLQLA